MKVIFVGMHNKGDKMPLCSSTKSGKLIDRIIKQIQPMECQKTNLYDIDHYPVNEDKRSLAMDWHERIEAYWTDAIVLLGAETHKNFIPLFENIIKIAHPASKRSHIEMDKYILDAVNKINLILNHETFIIFYTLNSTLPGSGPAGGNIDRL